MKKVTAYIKSHRLSDVTLALHQVEGMSGMSVSDGRGFGRGKAKGEKHSLKEDVVDYIPHVRIEIVCSDPLLEEIVSTIEKNAHTGLRGDGKVYVSDVESIVRISTGNRGEGAV
ncbi:MAG: P-II family nitrogen regulator [Candidatus Hydrogenedentes bacterium]|nr:P-II family nitrogen regulator [Candidatus Hydrogenedentota bacterium]